MPELPSLSFTDVSQEQVEAWAADKEAAYAAIDQ